MPTDLLVQRLDPAAKLPTYGSVLAAGLDLHALLPVRIDPGIRALVRTGFALSLPRGHVGLIWPRSGLAVNAGIDVLAGVIDEDYRGEIMIVVINHGLVSHTFARGDRVAQLLVQPIARPAVNLVTSFVQATERGADGFGSTGA